MVYWAQVNARLPFYDADNVAIASELPTPPETTLVQSGPCCDARIPIAARQWHLTYQTRLDQNTLAAFFRQELPPLGWNELATPIQPAARLEFQRASACLLIQFSNDELAIAIRHDFLAQPYSPWYPPLDPTRLWTLGYIDTCP